jgi:hypothetical protein
MTLTVIVIPGWCECLFPLWLEAMETEQMCLFQFPCQVSAITLMLGKECDLSRTFLEEVADTFCYMKELCSRLEWQSQGWSFTEAPTAIWRQRMSACLQDLAAVLIQLVFD